MEIKKRTMKRQTLINVLFLAVMITGCKNATTRTLQNEAASLPKEMEQTAETDEETLQLTSLNLTEKEWQEIKSSYEKLANAQNEIMSSDTYEGSLWLDLSGIADSSDVSLGGRLLYHSLCRQGYRFLTNEEYNERIRSVFGIDFNRSQALNEHKFKSYPDYTIAFCRTPEGENEKVQAATEFYPYKPHHYLLRKFNLCAVQMPSVLSVQMDENTNKEHIRVQKNAFDYHWNKYVLNDHAGSLDWLLANGKEEELKDLLLCFGYDREDKINELVLNDDDLSVADKFMGRDAEGNWKIYEGVLRFVERYSTASRSDYFAAAGAFVDQIAYDPDREDEKRKAYPQLENISLEERRKLIAYAVNTLQPLYEKYNGQDGYGNSDSYNIGVADCFWNAFFRDHELLAHIEAHQAYGLPNLVKLLRKMKADERLVNAETGLLEPWNWSPENDLSDTAE